MTWKCLELRYRALSPVHIGRPKLGMIQPTRAHIPGRALWGAATATLARYLISRDGRNADINAIYQAAGSAVAENCLFTCFFPSVIEPDGTETVYLPPPAVEQPGASGDVPEATGVVSERIDSRPNAERDLIHSTAATAIAPATATAEDESLHETEFISARRKTDGRSVFFLGYLLLKDFPLADESFDAKRLAIIWRELAVGGERKYGFGRLKLYAEPKSFAEGSRLWGSAGITVNGLDNERPAIHVVPWTPAPAYVKDKTGHGIGDIEPMVSRAWGGDKDPRSGAGQKLEFLNIAYAPGCTAERERRLVFGAGDRGVLIEQ